MERKKVAVFFGGKSYEHDVSILTGIDVVRTIDSSRYEAFPVYVDLDGAMWTGKELLDRKNYHLTPAVKSKLNRVFLEIGADKAVLKTASGLFKKAKEFPFDVAFPAFHGDFGEDGRFQGMCETAGIPYVGGRVSSSAVFMNKSLTKGILKSVGVPVLDECVIRRLADGKYDIDEVVKQITLPYPVIVKPNSLGSSVGVLKADNAEEAGQGLISVFALGDDALVEPFVENLEEYNISVSRAFGKTEVSVIERPLKDTSAFLGFKEKYLASGGTKGTKSASTNASGLLSLTRVFNPPELSQQETENIRNWAKTAFETLDTAGVVRIDFLCNRKTGEFYLGEVNSIPGSFAYYLWEASKPQHLYTDLLSALIEEAETLALKSKTFSLVKGNSLIFNRPSDK